MCLLLDEKMPHHGGLCGICGTGHNKHNWGNAHELHWNEEEGVTAGKSLFLNPEDVEPGVIHCLQRGERRFICEKKYHVLIRTSKPGKTCRSKPTPDPEQYDDLIITRNVMQSQFWYMQGELDRQEGVIKSLEHENRNLRSLLYRISSSLAKIVTSEDEWEMRADPVRFLPMLYWMLLA